MWAMIVKEFRQLRRDRRTLAMMIAMPVILLVVLGYAASFNVTSVSVTVVGPQAANVARELPRPFDIVAIRPGQGRDWAQDQLRDGHADVAVLADGSRPVVLIDGSQLFTAQATLAALSKLSGGLSRAQRPEVSILYNPSLDTSAVMIPGLAGVVLVFIGTIITSLGVVRERQSGTLEQLAVMPLRPRDVFLGKIVPYFAVAAVDLAIVLGVGIAIFGVPFRGSALVFALGALLFLFVTLGIGVLISTVSQNQGQAIQLAVMTMLPQMLLSGLIFPLSSIAAGVRWISYLLPLTYFNEIARGVMLRAEPIGPLWRAVRAAGRARGRDRHARDPAVPRLSRPGPHRPAPGPARAARSGERWRRGAGVTGSGPAAGGWGAEAIRVQFGPTVALADVSLTAAPGMVTVVVGGDGAGKTTLLRCLAGVLAPAAGSVRRPGPESIGYFPASTGTYPDLTVAENLAFRSTAYNLRGPQAAARADELTELAGLTAARDRPAGRLSGGMRRKLGVIAAMLHQPELLVLDEPSTGVDPVSRSGLWWLITRAAADGAAVVLATTYLDEAERAGAVLVLDAGRTLAAGSPADIVAAMPGTVRELTADPTGSAARRAWRRNGGWRVWEPPSGLGRGRSVGRSDRTFYSSGARKPGERGAGGHRQ